MSLSTSLDNILVNYSSLPNLTDRECFLIRLRHRLFYDYNTFLFALINNKDKYSQEYFLEHTIETPTLEAFDEFCIKLKEDLKGHTNLKFYFATYYICSGFYEKEYHIIEVIARYLPK